MNCFIKFDDNNSPRDNPDAARMSLKQIMDNFEECKGRVFYLENNQDLYI